jgi:peptidoglycan/LPS O-acetylase OafA/YrhL
MGTLRLLLALSVASGHAGPIFGWQGVFAPFAVEGFYIVSGFLITVVLHQKYSTPDRLWLFYTNRFLRIWAPYIVVALITLVAIKVGAKFGGQVLGGAHLFSKSAFQNLDALTFFAALATNILIVGQDLGMWLAYSPPSGLYLTPNFRAEPIQFNQLYIMDQSWTLGLELAFYLVAPFIVRRHWGLIVLLLGGSLGARLLTYSAGYDFDPWTYRFFPFELAFFLAGALSARFYLASTRLQSDQVGLPGRLMALSAVAVVAGWSYLPPVHHPEFLLFALICGALPFLFALTKDWAIDRYAGSLSYPVYLVHIPVILLIRSWSLEGTIGLSGLTVIPPSLLLAFLIVRYVEEPVDRFRQRRIFRGREAPAGEPIKSPLLSD